MPKKQLTLSDPIEAAILDQITIRVIRPDEQQRWDQLVSEHHYLKNANLVGAFRRYTIFPDSDFEGCTGCPTTEDW